MINKAILMGRLGRDPELRYTSAGSPVVNFSIATDENWKDQAGGRQSKIEWHNIVAWGSLAENCDQILKKGSLVYVEGRIQTREWTDRDENKQRSKEIVISFMKAVGNARAEEIQPEQQSRNRTNDDVPDGYSNDGLQVDDQEGYVPDDDDIPF